MTKQTIVINTSSSLFFTKIGLFPHLLKYFRLVTSEEILEEVLEGQQIGFKDAKIVMQYFEDKKIDIIKTKQTKEVMKNFKIKHEDASVISLAKELDCILATEDRQIGKISMIENVKVTNTASLLYYLYRKKEFGNKQSLLLLDLMIKNGYNKEICMKIIDKILGDKNV